MAEDRLTPRSLYNMQYVLDEQVMLEEVLVRQILSFPPVRISQMSPLERRLPTGDDHKQHSTLAAPINTPLQGRPSHTQWWVAYKY